MRETPKGRRHHEWRAQTAWRDSRTRQRTPICSARQEAIEESNPLLPAISISRWPPWQRADAARTIVANTCASFVMRRLCDRPANNFLASPHSLFHLVFNLDPLLCMAERRVLARLQTAYSAEIALANRTLRKASRADCAKCPIQDDRLARFTLNLGCLVAVIYPVPDRMIR